MFEYLRERGCPWDAWTCALAASNGHLECLKYAHEHGCVGTIGRASCRPNGQLECLKYAREHGCDWNEETCEMPPRMDIWSV